MKFIKDESKVKGFTAGRVIESGTYNCTITKCYLQDNLYPGSLAEAMHIDLVTSSGQFLALDLRIKTDEGKSAYKNGDNLIGIQQINDLMVILDINELSAKKGRVKIYDFEEKEEIDQVKTIFPQLIDQEIGCLIEVETRLKKIEINGQWVDNTEGKTKTIVNLRSFYSTESGRSAKEIIDNVEPVAIDNYLNYIIAKKQPVNAAPVKKQESQKAPSADIADDDIPF